jgi:hypothetical protein
MMQKQPTCLAVYIRIYYPSDETERKKAMHVTKFIIAIINFTIYLIVMLFSLYRVSAEGKFHLFTFIKNGNKKMMN